MGNHVPVCGIDDLSPQWQAVCVDDLIGQVTCDHCLAWIANQNKPVTHRQLDERVVNMNFDNSALISQGQIERAVEMGIAQAFAKLDLDKLIQDGVEKALQRRSVKANLIGIHKIAEDELKSEYDGSPEQEEDDRIWERDVKQALIDVLDEREQSGTGVGTTVVNVNAEVDPESFKDMVKDAIREEDEETIDDYNEEETVLFQKAMTSLMTSDQAQDWFKKLVKVALDERDGTNARLAVEFERSWLNHFEQDFHSSSPVSKGARTAFETVSYAGDDIEDFVHRRKLYTTETACGLTTGRFSMWSKDITCPDCRVGEQHKEVVHFRRNLTGKTVACGRTVGVLFNTAYGSNVTCPACKVAAGITT